MAVPSSPSVGFQTDSGPKMHLIGGVCRCGLRRAWRHRTAPAVDPQSPLLEPFLWWKGRATSGGWKVAPAWAGRGRLDLGRPSTCRYFHGHATGPIRRARDCSRINWLSISSMSHLQPLARLIIFAKPPDQFPVSSDLQSELCGGLVHAASLRRPTRTCLPFSLGRSRHFLGFRQTPAFAAREGPEPVASGRFWRDQLEACERAVAHRQRGVGEVKRACRRAYAWRVKSLHPTVPKRYFPFTNLSVRPPTLNHSVFNFRLM
jgi:hypothetical protein